MKALVVLCMFLGVSFTVFSQNITPVSVKYFNKTYSGGKVVINQSSELQNYIETYVGLNKKRRGFSGYRIKIYAQNNAAARNQSNSIRLNFEESYKNHKAYVTYVEPNFEVHVGDFCDRFEAVAFMNEISGRYPESYIIKTIIAFPNREIKEIKEK